MAVLRGYTLKHVADIVGITPPRAEQITRKVCRRVAKDIYFSVHPEGTISQPRKFKNRIITAIKQNFKDEFEGVTCEER
jgi:hypothetical protein